jgi:hypothetical protein
LIEVVASVATTMITVSCALIAMGTVTGPLRAPAPFELMKLIGMGALLSSFGTAEIIANNARIAKHSRIPFSFALSAMFGNFGEFANRSADSRSFVLFGLNGVIQLLRR